jgi:eukaryotic-like serine/threonine-protein kinase
MENTVIHGVSDYEILGKIASGGMGSVFLGEQLGAESFRKTVAIKIIKKEFLNNPESISLFIGEAKLTADLIHQCINQVYQLGETSDGQFYIVMEYIHGKTLSDLMRAHHDRGIKMDIEMGAFIISRVCRGLAYAHKKKDRNGNHLGIVHRDVTPSNIMFDFLGSVKLMDFGIAKALTMSTPDESQVIMGKLPYMSPEAAQFIGTDPRSDIFSLGLVMYELLTGFIVYNVKSIQELITKMKKYRIKDPSKLNPHIPARVEEIILKALEVNPGNRFQTAEEMLEAIEVYLYHDRYGPTNEKLAKYVRNLYPDVDPDKVVL